MEKMPLKQFLESAVKDSPMQVLTCAEKLMQLEQIENYLNLLWGIDLEINVVPAVKHEGRYFGKSLIDKI